MNDTKQSILLIEDDDVIIQSLIPALEELNLDIHTLTCGKSALEVTKSLMPDLILLDIIMPESNGHDVCVSLKAERAISHIPIIFLTSKTATKDIVKGFDVGGADYICKPFNRQELQARVKTQLKLKRETEERINREESLQRAISELQVALKENRELKELLPICCNCKKIRDDQGYWQRLEQFFNQYAGVQFSHSVCPECITVLYPDYAKRKSQKDL